MRRLAQFVLLAILLADFLPVRAHVSLSSHAEATAPFDGLTPSIDGVQRNLTQVEGELNGNKRIFEWIVDKNGQ